MKKLVIITFLLLLLHGQNSFAQHVREVIRLDGGQWFRVLATDEVQRSSNGITFQTVGNLQNILPANRGTVSTSLWGSKYLGATIYYRETYQHNGQEITKYLGAVQGKNWKEVPENTKYGVAYGQASAGNKNNAFGHWMIRREDGMVMYSVTGVSFQETGAKALIHEHKRDLPLSPNNLFVHDGHLIVHHSSEKRGFFRIPKEGGFGILLSNTDQLFSASELIQHPDNSAKLYSHVAAVSLGDPTNTNDPSRRCFKQNLQPAIFRWAKDKNINYSPVSNGPAYELVQQWIRDNHFYVRAKIRVSHGSTASNREQTFRIHLGDIKNMNRLFQFDATFEPTDERFIPEANPDTKANTPKIRKVNPTLKPIKPKTGN